MHKSRERKKMKLIAKIWDAVARKGESLSEEEKKNYEEAISNDKMEDVTNEVIKSFSTSSYTTVFKILLGVLLISSIVIFSVSFMRYTELQKRKQVLENEVKEIEAEIEELQYLIGVPKDDYEYMVRMAKQKLGLYYPDETIFYNDTNK